MVHGESYHQLLEMFLCRNPAGIYLSKVNNRNTGAMCDICSKLLTKTPEWRQWRRSDVFIVRFEQISDVVLGFPLLILNKWMPAEIVPALKVFEIFQVEGYLENGII